MTSLLKILPQMLRQVGDAEEAREQAVFAAWAAIAGDQVRKLTEPIRLERKTLIVAVTDSTWRTQLKKIRSNFLFKLNSLLGSPIVTGIEFVINPELIERARELPHKISFIAPERQALPLRQHADRIADSELRATFLRAAGKCLERRAR